jgi:hypothetical protein
VRVPWHDTDWTGRVCASPGSNHSCAILPSIKENKDSVQEQDDRGKLWADVPGRLPPCVLERAGFMRTKTFTQKRTHRYAWNRHGAHAHFAETPQRMPPYSLEVTPFRWVMLEEFHRYAEVWGIEVDSELEERAARLMNFDSDWVQDKRNQLALLDSFFSALKPGASLVLLYAKDLPLIEEGKPGERYLIGAGFVEKVDPWVEWEYEREGELQSIMWERGVHHSIRNSNTNGFLLPYRQLLADPALRGADLEQFVARTPQEHFDEFSYVSELVSHDGAIAALTELARVVDLLPSIVDGPWDGVRSWIAERLGEAWHARGPYPGMGPMLVAADLERGSLLARRVLDDLPDGADPWRELEKAVEENRHGLVGRIARRAWAKLTSDEQRYRQLRVMSRFALNVDQAKALFAEHRPGDVIDNPYCLYESGAADRLAFPTIDRGLWPRDTAARAALAADPIDEPVTEAADDRRVRAACVHLLEYGAENGHTLLDEAGMRRRLAALDLEPLCDPSDTAFEFATEGFAPLLVERELARDAGRGWQLDRLAEVDDRIRADVLSRVEDSPLDIHWDWAERIKGVLPEVTQPDSMERQARDEKATALETIMRARLSVLVGPAGTGKTSMLEALCADPVIGAEGILLLAPTGKAAVQLTARTGKPARTLAQFLGGLNRWDWESGTYYLAAGERTFAGAKTVVIDEASMLTEEMLAATIDALGEVDRLILCGDPRQLPPIGAGRPFADLLAFLRTDPGPGGGVAELGIVRRQTAGAAGIEGPLDDVAVGSLFSIDAVLPGAEETLIRVLSGDGDGRIRVLTWTDEPDLHRKLVQAMGEETALGLDSLTRGAICRSFGAECDDGGLPRFPWGSAGEGAENWQVLSPVRAREGGVTGINQLVRATWRGTDTRMAMRSRNLTSPMCADGIIFADKVMCLRNKDKRRAKDPETWEQVSGRVANGEVGLVVRPAKSNGRPKGHAIEFSSQPGLQYDFWDNELNSGDERQGEWLELAYAVTVHKSQGSQFRVTFVVVPDPCPLLSPELLYTALTRQRDKVIVLKQGDASRLREFASVTRSETAKRLTCLFRPPDPFALGDGRVVDAAHVHRTARDELVISKSEVIVADALNDLRLDYRYEQELQFPGEIARHPDFTIARPGSTPVYWEHLGMLDRAGYRADWAARKRWYASHDILPWTEGGGPQGTLVWSHENVGSPGISSHEIRKLARDVFAAED